MVHYLACILDSVLKKPDDLKNLKDCRVLKGNIEIFHDSELTENDLETLSSIRFLYGYVRVKSDTLKNLRFIRNLQVIDARYLM